MQSRYIYHFCPRPHWDAAVADGVYEGRELDQRDGFIHFSAPEQVRETAALHLSGVTGLVLIKVDSRRLGDALKWEKSRNSQLFPHVYGPLDPDSVETVTDLPIGEDGLHIFPELK